MESLVGLKKISRLAIARHVLRPLINYTVIRPLTETIELQFLCIILHQ